MDRNLNKTTRLAKNTVFLYIRMLMVMIITFYTSRVILRMLGVQDYGIYNVVGGAVSMLSLLTSSLSTAISRFITFALGNKDIEKLKTVFSTSIVVQCLMSIIVIIIAEIIGVWFLNTRLNIPNDRIPAAHWVLQCSILTFAINLIGVPYNAAIIAHEKMSAYAYIGIIEVIIKLIVVLGLSYSPYDKLVSYSVLLVGVSISIVLMYIIFARNNFDECRFSKRFDKSLVKELFGFAGWNLLGTSAHIFNTQGINILTNIYFGVVINAARGVTDQVQSAVMQFVTNFTTAFNPQITKSYAAHDYSYLFSLIYKGAKFSFFLMLIFCVPLMFEIETLLGLWLGEYPAYTPTFIRLSLMASMIDFLGNQTARTVWATGNIKLYYIVTCSVSILVFPISLLLFKLGFPPFWSYITFISIYLILIPLRLLILHQILPEFSPLNFVKNVIFVIIPVVCCSFTLPFVINLLLPNNMLSSFIIMSISILNTIFSIYLIGMNQNERDFIMLMVKDILKKCK